MIVYTKDEIREAFKKWLERYKAAPDEYEDVDDPDAMADYLVELMEEPTES